MGSDAFFGVFLYTRSVSDAGSELIFTIGQRINCMREVTSITLKFQKLHRGHTVDPYPGRGL